MVLRNAEPIAVEGRWRLPVEGQSGVRTRDAHDAGIGKDLMSAVTGGLRSLLQHLGDPIRW